MLSLSRNNSPGGANSITAPSLRTIILEKSTSQHEAPDQSDVKSNKQKKQRLNQSINQSIEKSFQRSINQKSIWSMQTEQDRKVIIPYRVLSIIVFKRCAMVRIVQSPNLSRIVVWINASVSKSIAAVASSRMRIFVFRSNARARQINCLWPTLQSNGTSYFTKEKRQGFFTALDHNKKMHWNRAEKPENYLKFSPPSATMCSSPSGNDVTKRRKWALSSALHTSSSE